MIDPSSPPDLTHSSIVAATIDGQPVPARDLFWSRLLLFVVRRASTMLPKQEVRAMIDFGIKTGRNPGRGHEFVEELGVSISGMNANGTWRAIHHMLTRTGMSAEIQFRWPSKSQTTSTFTVPKSIHSDR